MFYKLQRGRFQIPLSRLTRYSNKKGPFLLLCNGSKSKPYVCSIQPCLHYIVFFHAGAAVNFILFHYFSFFSGNAPFIMTFIRQSGVFLFSLSSAYIAPTTCRI